MNEQHFLERVRSLAGILDQDDHGKTRRMVVAVLSVLSEQLPASDRAWLRSMLSPGLAAALHQGAPAPVHSLEAFYQEVSARAGDPPGMGVEHTQCVCRALAEALDADALRHLRSRVPDALETLFLRPAESHRPLAPERTRGAAQRTQTLARGQPGSRHPVSESQPSHTQRNSVASETDPHAETKLSTAHGMTQEREHETLAENRPHKP